MKWIRAGTVLVVLVFWLLAEWMFFEVMSPHWAILGSFYLGGFFAVVVFSLGWKNRRKTPDAPPDDPPAE